MAFAVENEAFFDLPPFQLRLVHGALPGTLADELMTHLPAALPWYQARLQLFGQWHWSPRLQCWLGDPGTAYRYSGHEMRPEPWPAILQSVRECVSELAGTAFNSVLCNWYRHRRDSMGWHSDNEPELGPAPLIASLTLGEERRFQFRRTGERRLFAGIDLPHNSLLIMPPGLQANYQHQLPKTRRSDGDRFNLTFRRIETATA
ncbi:alpha-ketoglutarate-dependent dioxygenase AlkB [Marinobacter halodurans]|uniref:Alpha-ketoglutarate-dependent dioxygenase AlkB n=1 Tax=Marinobacter halodurans TaxID=2528979 RepID=A0ABY1ZSY8_9GAMM|nr:alpha-ketoglutarate-dependent dioxygenase AlkB [Marinobacter halodurans]TBW59575.1 alpha-ketoglutarate-dependent dioxygenase AlkB [Marinobacter halodurans]